MHVHSDDDSCVERNVAQLRLLYPTDKLVLIYDGVSVRGHDCTEIAGDRLKVAGELGRWTERYLKIFFGVVDYTFDQDRSRHQGPSADCKSSRPIGGMYFLSDGH